MRRALVLAAALGALIAMVAAIGASAASNGPVTVEQGNLRFTFDGGFSPTKLPKKKEAPITLKASGKIATKDGTHPPALKEVILQTDKNGSINVKGVPVCRSGQLQARDTKAARKACGKALIGTGKANVEVQFPEQRPIPVSSQLLVFNGGKHGATTTLFIHAFFSSPVNGAIVTTVKVKKIHKGRYGLQSVARIPKIANGSGSLTSFNLKISRRGVLTAKCTDGKLQAFATSIFSDGTKASAGIVRPCRSIG